MAPPQCRAQGTRPGSTSRTVPATTISRRFCPTAARCCSPRTATASRRTSTATTSRRRREAADEYGGQRVLADRDAGREDVLGDSQAQPTDATAGGIRPATGANPQHRVREREAGWLSRMDRCHARRAVHSWIRTGQPATLQIGDTKTGTAEVVATGIGRSVLVRPGAGTVSYITTGADRMVAASSTRRRADRRRSVSASSSGSQDAVWTPDGAIADGERHA